MKKLFLFVLIFIASIMYASEKGPLEFKPKTSNKMDILCELFAWIPANIKYDFEYAIGARRSNIDTSAEIVLRDGKAVCLGWSLVFQKYVKEYVGLPCQVVYVALRDSAWIKHAINCVLIDGTWYYFDVTWGGEQLNEGENEIIVKIDWNYFMYEEAQMKKLFIVIKKRNS